MEQQKEVFMIEAVFDCCETDKVEAKELPPCLHVFLLIIPIHIVKEGSIAVNK